MSGADAKSPKRNPLRPLRTPKPLPAARSRAALGLAAAVAEGAFRLQICESCGAAQYPPRELCVQCLGDLVWRDVARDATLVASTNTRIGAEPYFRERAPWPTGLVKLASGPIAVAHLHPECVNGERVRLSIKLDPAGRGALHATPDRPGVGADDKADRAFGADVRGRNALVVDGRASTASALVGALVEAGAARVLVGLGESWRPALSFAGADIVSLDVTDAKSVESLADLYGDKVDILINNCDAFRAEPADAARSRAMFDVHALGALRLQAAFAPILNARAAEVGRSSAAYVSVISTLALSGSGDYAAYAAAQAALRSINQTLRAESRASGLKVVDVLVGPIDDEWRQSIRPPKVTPASLAAAIVAALRHGLEEVVVGDVAKEIHAKWAEDPRLFRRETP